MEPLRIYTASKVVHAPKWRDLRDKGYPVISTWIDEAGPGESANLRDLWIRCIEEAADCNLLLAYREPGEVLKGVFIEIGVALSRGLSVYCVGDFAGFTFTHHPKVYQVPNLPYMASVFDHQLYLRRK